MQVGEVWIPDLQGNGPPPWSFNDQFEVPRIFNVPTLAHLRQIRTHQFNERALVLLKGQDEPYDGYLQGLYEYWPNLATAQPDDGGSWIWVEDKQSAWRKIT